MNLTKFNTYDFCKKAKNNGSKDATGRAKHNVKRQTTVTQDRREPCKNLAIPMRLA